MTKYGKVNHMSTEFEWQIDDFFSLLEDGEKCESPQFSFANEFWYFGLYPNGDNEENSIGDVDLYLYRRKHSPPIHLTFFLSLKTVDGKKDGEKQYSCTYGKMCDGFGFGVFMKRSELLERRAQLMPSNNLTVVCTMQQNSKSSKNSDSEAECSYCGEYFGDKYVSSHEEKCLDKPVRCPTCKDSLVLRDWYQHECDMGRVRATKRLIDDLGNILERKEHSDIIIKVKEATFCLHRNILAGRSPYFSSNFKSEMKEKTTSTITIDDCDADAFRAYALYIYTGEVEDMNVGNVCDLYKVANKFQEDKLKEECLSFIKSRMSVANFCDFIVLFLKHDEKELLQYADDFFCEEITEIVQNFKWQQFMCEYPAKANEMYMKACDSKKK